MTFSGRTVIWAADREQIARRPLQGWGWMGAWKDQTFLDRLASRGQPVFEAHSGYYEVLLGTGFLGFIIFAVLLGLIVLAVLDALFRRRDTASLVLVAFVTFALVLNISETFDTAHQIPWLLLVASGYLALGSNGNQDELHLVAESTH
jgi:O-antigen ligase